MVDNISKFKLGDKFFYLTIIDGPLIINGHSNFKCKCECGNERFIPCYKFGINKSCGCQKRMLIRKHKEKFYPKINDIINNLTIISKPLYLPDNNKVYFRCRCICGKEITKRYDVIKIKNSSCGCVLHKDKNVTHGLTKTKLYNKWSAMKYRCSDINGKYFKHYASKGIKVCDEWKNDFMIFRDWALANGYNDSLSLERKNPDKDYYPENCEWITSNQNSKNVYLYREKERKELLDKIKMLEKENIELKKKLCLL